jgi:hypothetical protein
MSLFADLALSLRRPGDNVYSPQTQRLARLDRGPLRINEILERIAK